MPANVDDRCVVFVEHAPQFVMDGDFDILAGFLLHQPDPLAIVSDLPLDVVVSGPHKGTDVAGPLRSVLQQDKI